MSQHGDTCLQEHGNFMIPKKTEVKGKLSLYKKVQALGPQKIHWEDFLHLRQTLTQDNKPICFNLMKQMTIKNIDDTLYNDKK